jgi:hypothetical protein
LTEVLVLVLLGTVVGCTGVDVHVEARTGAVHAGDGAGLGVRGESAEAGGLGPATVATPTGQIIVPRARGRT